MRCEVVDEILAELFRRSGAIEDRTLPQDEEGFLAIYAASGWHLRKYTPAPCDDLAASLAKSGVLGASSWSVADLGRVLLLRRHLSAASDDAAAPLVERIFRTGDNHEREALLKTLMALPSPERFLATAIDACRAAVRTTFTAIACDNAYPARHFPAPAFRSMVVKALHLDVPLNNIHGLTERRDAELARMGEDYANERRFAGRPVPSDISLITALETAS